MDKEVVKKETLEKNLELQNETNESNKILNFNENKKEISSANVKEIYQNPLDL